MNRAGKCIRRKELFRIYNDFTETFVKQSVLSVLINYRINEK